MSFPARVFMVALGLGVGEVDAAPTLLQRQSKLTGDDMLKGLTAADLGPVFHEMGSNPALDGKLDGKILERYNAVTDSCEKNPSQNLWDLLSETISEKDLGTLCKDLPRSGNDWGNTNSSTNSLMKISRTKILTSLTLLLGTYEQPFGANVAGLLAHGTEDEQERELKVGGLIMEISSNPTHFKLRCWDKDLTEHLRDFITGDLLGVSPHEEGYLRLLEYTDNTMLALTNPKLILKNLKGTLFKDEVSGKTWHPEVFESQVIPFLLRGEDNSEQAKQAKLVSLTYVLLYLPYLRYNALNAQEVAQAQEETYKRLVENHNYERYYGYAYGDFLGPLPEELPEPISFNQFMINCNEETVPTVVWTKEQQLLALDVANELLEGGSSSKSLKSSVATFLSSIRSDLDERVLKHVMDNASLRLPHSGLRHSFKGYGSV